jgi:hypothetical protein
MHIVDICSHKLRRVARSTAETRPGSERCDLAFYCRAVAEWMSVTLLKGMSLVLDNLSLYADVITTREPKEKRLKVDLALIREAFEGGELAGIKRAERRTNRLIHLKNDEKSDTSLLLVMSDGCLRHSYQKCAYKYPPNLLE